MKVKKCYIDVYEFEIVLVNSKIESILEDVKIEDISNIDILKDNIAKNPDDIYLIDENKIIKKETINSS